MSRSRRRAVSWGSGVFAEAEGFDACDVGTDETGAPVFFNVFNDEVSAGEVIHAGGAFGVVHGVGHVPHKGHIFAEIDLLTDGERPAEHAHVEVNSAEDDVLDATFLEKVPRFLAVVGERIAGEDFEGRDLAGPRRDDVAFFSSAGAAHVGIVDGERTFVFAIRPAPGSSPAFVGREGNGSFRERGGGCEDSGGGLAVETGHAAGRMDDKHAAVACGLDHLVHGTGHFCDAACGGFAPMVVPHIADDDCRFCGVPCGGGFGDFLSGFRARTQM